MIGLSREGMEGAGGSIVAAPSYVHLLLPITGASERAHRWHTTMQHVEVEPRRAGLNLDGLGCNTR